jgi:hypothetical protein
VKNEYRTEKVARALNGLEEPLKRTWTVTTRKQKQNQRNGYEILNRTEGKTRKNGIRDTLEEVKL